MLLHHRIEVINLAQVGVRIHFTARLDIVVLLQALLNLPFNLHLLLCRHQFLLVRIKVVL